MEYDNGDDVETSKRKRLKSQESTRCVLQSLKEIVEVVILVPQEHGLPQTDELIEDFPVPR